MKFLERQWYFKGEALAKHPMGKCAKSIHQSSLTPLVSEWSTHDTDFHPPRKRVLVEEENFCGESIVSQIGVLGKQTLRWSFGQSWKLTEECPRLIT